MTHSSQPGCCHTCRARVGITDATLLAKACLDAGLHLLRASWDTDGVRVQVHGIGAQEAAQAIGAHITGYRVHYLIDYAEVAWESGTAIIAGTTPDPVAAVNPRIVPFTADEHPSPTATVSDFDGPRNLDTAVLGTTTPAGVA